MSAATAIRIEGLKKYFTEGDTLLRRLRPGTTVQLVKAVDGVDLAVPAGATVGLVGESGCGKSTLARAVLRLIEPTDGEVYFEGENIMEYTDSELRAFRGDVQMVFQDPFSSLNPRYTVRRTLVEPMQVHGIGDSTDERRERAATLLHRVGLSEEHLDRFPHEFSGGQRQRVAIARALAVEPTVIVADEPVSALDVSVQAQILNLLDDLRSEMELTMLFISHDLSVVRQICDHVAVMYLGRIVENAPTNELFEVPKHPYSQVLMSSIPAPDPTIERDKTTLEGDVPTPIDPPSGCRFHPRCPKVIPPEEWGYSQDAWRRILQFKKRVEDREVRPAAMRAQLKGREDGRVSDQAVIEALYEEHLAGVAPASDGPASVPQPVRQEITEVLSLLVDDEWAAAVTRLDEQFSTVCEDRHPAELEVGSDRTVECHLYDDGEPGEPDPIHQPLER